MCNQLQKYFLINLFYFHTKSDHAQPSLIIHFHFVYFFNKNFICPVIPGITGFAEHRQRGADGTLFTPSEPKEKIPVVLIIAGSGPTDRNGNNIAGINCNAYEMLADSLAKYGIASLRYDKRGVAASRSALADESKITIDVYINDAKCGWRNWNRIRVFQK